MYIYILLSVLNLTKLEVKKYLIVSLELIRNNSIIYFVNN